MLDVRLPFARVWLMGGSLHRVHGVECIYQRRCLMGVVIHCHGMVPELFVNGQTMAYAKLSQLRADGSTNVPLAGAQILIAPQHGSFEQRERTVFTFVLRD